jgi:hypothetical protein
LNRAISRGFADAEADQKEAYMLDQALSHIFFGLRNSSLFGGATESEVATVFAVNTGILLAV